MLGDRDFQNALNSYRKKEELKEIDFTKISSSSDFKIEGDQYVSFQQLVNTIQEELDQSKRGATPF